MTRPRKTLTDYAVIAISPALIMVFIGSLVFFLIEAFYQGHYDGRIRWAFGWFVFAAVLIGRISIDEGRQHASLYAIPLALAMLAVLSRFVAFSGPLAGLSLPINAGLILLVLWCADRLTWDCTVIDDRKDVSGQGLLQTAGLDRHDAADQTDQPSPTQDLADQDPAATSSRDTPLVKTCWERFCEHRRRPHAPGVWVIYLSLAALPLFGIGQRFIPATNLESRRDAFWLLGYFVASALGLLLSSSFLALRRHLRQRRLEMPLQMAGVWLGTGAIMIVVLLVLCAALPRPHPEYSITHIDWSIGSPEGLRPSRYGVGQQGAQDPDRREKGQESSSTETKGQPQESTSHNGEPQNAAQSGDTQGGQEQNGQEQGGQEQGGQGQNDAGQSDAGQGRSGDNGRHQQDQRQEGQAAGDSKSEGDSSDRSSRDGAPDQPRSTGQPTGENQDGQESSSTDSQTRTEDSQRAAPGSRPPSRSPIQPRAMLNSLFNGMAHVIKWLYYLVFLGIAAYLVWRYWEPIRAAVLGFVQAIREMWAKLTGGRTRVASSTVVQASGPRQPPPRPFAAFADPFATGEAQRLDPRELVLYTFQALEAWARDHQLPRMDDQTPHEFAGQLARVADDIGREANRLADLYGAAAYSNLPLAWSTVGCLEDLWKTMKGVSQGTAPQEPGAQAGDRQDYGRRKR
jgi:hypothetical protein